MPPAALQPAAPGNPFDRLYDRDFRLRALAADPIVSAAKPLRAKSLAQAWIDPTYGTRLYRATAADEGGGGRVRHEYSRRQAFNANNTRYLVQDGAGSWYLYHATTFRRLRALDGLAGDSEPLWHATDPSKLYATARNGGMRWWIHDVETGKRELLFDFTGKTPWPTADAYWTKSEGTTSADGRYLALMATRYDGRSKQEHILGLLVFDLAERRIVSTLDADRFNNVFPDHVSMSPSGKYVVPSWGKGEGGTRAYTRDFASNRLLFDGSEHSDLAFGPERQDFYVYTDYTGTNDGKLMALDIERMHRFSLASIYQGDAESYSAHISGQAFDRPGWVVVSTYADAAKYGKQAPAATLRPQYRKVWLAELRPGGRKLSVAHIRASASRGKDYFAEPHASASRDLSRIVFSSNFGEGAPDDYIVGLPSWVLEP